MKLFSYLCTAVLILLSFQSQAQKWVDTAYQISLTQDVIYGTDTNYAGYPIDLKMDITVPTNDVAPSCGRPLMILVHGGAFIAGDKSDAAIARMAKQFAQRGYVTANINYRLGVFNPSAAIHCNVDNWDCANTADTMEWYRAVYRAQQDTKGALRFMLQQKSTYNIDARNVFFVGESAGAITVLHAAFVDMASEKPIEVGAIASVNAPNSIYETQCVQATGGVPNIASMRLTRPDLGSVEGPLNQSTVAYQLKGVGSFYGGLLNSYFNQAVYTKAPALYMFHQPNDLLVPYHTDRVLAGIAYCATLAPFNCQYIVNRPFISGSRDLKNAIDILPAGNLKPIYQLDTTNNNADCYAQLLNPATAGHAIDNYWLRTSNMAQFFAQQIDTAGPCNLSVTQLAANAKYQVQPNPSSGQYMITGLQGQEDLMLYDMTGKLLASWKNNSATQMAFDLNEQPNGVYILNIYSQGQKLAVLKLMKY